MLSFNHIQPFSTFKEPQFQWLFTFRHIKCRWLRWKSVYTRCQTSLVLRNPTMSLLIPVFHSQTSVSYQPVDALWKYDVKLLQLKVPLYSIPFLRSNVSLICRSAELTRAVGCHSSITWTSDSQAANGVSAASLSHEGGIWSPPQWSCSYCNRPIHNVRHKNKQAIGWICVFQACHHFCGPDFNKDPFESFWTWITLVPDHFQNHFLSLPPKI